MRHCTRRNMLHSTGLMIGAMVFRGDAFSAEGAPASGAISGEPTAAAIGQDILHSGGNAIDAVLAAALAATVVSPQNCGVGGYGGHMLVALAQSRKIVSIDFNTAAPARADPRMFPVDEHGVVRSKTNEYGWLSAGVPGTIAGIELAARKYASRPFRDLLTPAITLAEDGFVAGKRLSSVIRTTAANLKKDPATAELYLPNGQPPEADEIVHNRDLARLLRALAEENSIEPFYRGSIAREIASAFQRNGGLVTLGDLSAYEAREVEPYELRWEGFSIYTAPLTAGGLTPVQALHTLQYLDWKLLTPVQKAHARIEALRLAWADRLALLGDPNFVAVPTARLLSREYAESRANQITNALKEGKPIALSFDVPPDGGTVNLSCADTLGNLAAITLTHGNSFGAQVTVPGLGLTLGHGMSRFDPRPDRPNSVGGAKRPLHNMCPTIVARDGRPLVALGGAGGRKIPNSIFDVLVSYCQSNGSVTTALETPRCHTVGDLDLTLEQGWRESDIASLKAIGYKIQTGSGALVSTAAFDPATGLCRAASR